MMKKIVLLIIWILIANVLHAQNQEVTHETRPLNNLSLGIFGDASLISINYERQFIISPTFILSGKLGLGHMPQIDFCTLDPCPPAQHFLTIPHHITANLGRGKHFFEFGFGGTIMKGNIDQSYILYPTIGYRFLPLESKKFCWRIFGQIPLTGTNTVSILPTYLGANIGISF